MAVSQTAHSIDRSIPVAQDVSQGLLLVLKAILGSKRSAPKHTVMLTTIRRLSSLAHLPISP